MRCPRCGELVKRDPSRKVCARCALEALAAVFEEEGPGDTLAVISAGEQLGAALRKDAGRLARTHRFDLKEGGQ